MKCINCGKIPDGPCDEGLFHIIVNDDPMWPQDRVIMFSSKDLKGARAINVGTPTKAKPPSTVSRRPLTRGLGNR